MDVMPWQAVVFVSIPEAFLVNLMGLSLVGARPELKRLGMAAAVQALASFAIRALPMVYGIHIIMQILVAVILIKIFLRFQWRVIIPGILLGMVIFIGVLDSLYIPYVVKIIPLEKILASPWIRVAVSLPQQLVMLLII
ncbi:MAG: hypothetical protein QME73_13170, partial [Bacillota bacterium]|nr:hypothetical protein [Bacillota bacterium]